MTPEDRFWDHFLAFQIGIVCTLLLAAFVFALVDPRLG